MLEWTEAEFVPRKQTKCVDVVEGNTGQVAEHQMMKHSDFVLAECAHKKVV